MNLEPDYIFIIATVFTVLFGLAYRRHNQKVMQSRAAILSDCQKMIERPEYQADSSGFARILGQSQGLTVALAIEVDNLTARKLPVMWLHLTVFRSRPATESLDILVRPQTTDIFSPSWDWAKSVTPLGGWPEHARYMTMGEPPLLQAIDNDVKTLFADKRCKELLVTPERIRLTYMARQADRGHYLLLRAAEFDYTPIDADEVAALLRQLQHLLVNLEEVCHEAA